MSADNKKAQRPNFFGKGAQNQQPQRPKMERIKTVWVTEKTEPFEEHFIVGEQLGEPGQFGRAFRCQRKSDNKIFAVKQVSKARFYRIEKEARRRQALLIAMKGEIDIMRRLKHEYIVNMESVYEDKHNLYIVMEECRGGELFDRIREKGKYNEKQASFVIKMVLEALHYMHEYHRVVHCDLKPDNILFLHKGDDSPIKIIDFGMSKILPRLRSLRELCGTPYYTAPEIIKGEYAHEADMWSVGVIMFVMIFGYPPFYVDPNKFYGKNEAAAIYQLIEKGFIPEVRKGYGPWFPQKVPVSEEVKDLMSRLLETDRAKRMNAKEALLHPWIKHGGVIPPKEKENMKLKENNNNNNNNNNIKKDEENEEIISKEIIAQFAQFTNNCNFKLAVIQIFRAQFQKMLPSHFENLKHVFEKLDKDGNGKISYEEFEEGMSKLHGINVNKEQIKQMFEELDVKSLGEICFDELLNAAVHDYLVASDERLYAAFRELDEDDDGKIQTKQLKEKLKEADPYGNYNDVLKVIDDADLDKNGEIDYEEFLRALHPDFNETPQWFWEAQKKGKNNNNNNNNINNNQQKLNKNNNNNNNNNNNDEDNKEN